MSATTKQRTARRKQRVSRSGNAPPRAGHFSRRRFRWRNRYLRGAVWLFLIAFMLTVVGVAIVNVKR